MVFPDVAQAKDCPRRDEAQKIASKRVGEPQEFIDMADK